MKKIAILALLALVTTGAFAQIEMSAGGGLFLDYSANNGFNIDGGYFLGERIFSFGGFVFFDANYIEVDLGFSYGSPTFYGKGTGFSSSSDGGSYTQVNLSLLGKYPMEMGIITFFPLIGIHYNWVLSWKDPSNGIVYTDQVGEYNSQFGILGGVGLDYNLTDALYLRGEALFHLRFPMKGWKELAKEFEETNFFKTDATLGVGPQIKVALGYRF